MSVIRSKTLLFLDFDGVLHPNYCPESQWFGRCGFLCEAIGLHELQIIISSSWRFHHPYESLLSYLPDAIKHRVMGCTGVAVVGRYARYREIREFLSRNPGWEDWRALDDAAWEFPASCPQLIRCDGGVGIGKHQADALVKWLRVC